MADVQHPNGDEGHDTITQNPRATNEGDGGINVELELESSVKKQFIVKLGFQTHNLEGVQLANENSKTAPDNNLQQKNPLDDSLEEPTANFSSPYNRGSSGKPQTPHTASNQNSGAKSLPTLKEFPQHVEESIAVPNESMVGPDNESRPPILIKQEPSTSEVSEGARQEQLLVSNAMNSGVNKEDDITHVPNSTEPSDHSSNFTTHQIRKVEHNGKERDDGAHEESGYDNGPHESHSVEDLISTSLEKIMDQFESPESSLKANNRGDLEGEGRKHDFSMNENHENEYDHLQPTISMLEDQIQPEEGRFSGEDRSSEESDSEGSDNQDVEIEEEGETQEDDEMPHRGHMRSRAHSQALNSALSEAELWEQRLKNLQDKINRTKPVALSQHGSQTNNMPLSRADGDQQQGGPHLGSHRIPGTHRAHDVSTAANMNIPNQNHFSQQRHQYEQRFQTVPPRDRLMPTGFLPTQPNYPDISQMAAMNYPGGPQGSYPYGRLLQQDMGFHHSGYPPEPFGQMLPGHPHAPYPPQPYDFSGRTPMSFARNQWPHLGQDRSAYQTNEHDSADEQETQLSEDGSNDDEPLKERVKLHPSILSHDSGIDSSSPPRASAKKPPHHDHGSEEEPLTSLRKLKSSHAKNPVRMHRPLPQPTQAADKVMSSPSSGSGIGSWKLPVFEVQRQPKENEDDGPLVKVSIPNLVREELLLSPDHADQEIHLLLNIFVPGQQALATPDPEPAVAVLNFHTIALMVVEAFVQFEIGDEFGLGRGHWHSNYDQGDAEYKRMRNAKDANADDIFFAVIDRWRAGLESKKKNLELIRGVQEFCDVALDVIYYIKDHGLLSTEPDPKPRAQRSDKGKTRGSKKDQDEESDEVEVSKGKSKKRGAAPDVNVVHARKKVKTEKKALAPKSKPKAKPKSKPKPKSRSRVTPGVTVITRR